MATLRFKETSDPEQLKILGEIAKIETTKQPYEPQKTPPYSLDSERRAWKALLKIIIQMKQKYPTSIERDKELLKESLSLNKRNLIIIRLGQKVILKSLIETATAVISALEGKWDQCIEKIAANRHKKWAVYQARLLKLIPNKDMEHARVLTEIGAESQNIEKGNDANRL